MSERSERTIGGKPIKEVFEQLQKDIPGVVKMTKEKGYPYLEVDMLRQYFDHYVPVQNYDFLVSDLQYVAAGNTACFMCIGTLTIYDDCGIKIVSKSYIGSNDCIQRKDGNGFVDFAMSARTAAVHARKSCIEMFGCGRNQLEAAKDIVKREKKKGENARSRCAEGSSGTEADPKRPPYGTGRFQLVCTDAAKISNLPKMYLIPVKAVEYGDYETRLLIWKNSIRDVDGTVAQISRGQAFMCSGKYEPYGSSHRIVLSRLGESA